MRVQHVTILEYVVCGIINNMVYYQFRLRINDVQKRYKYSINQSYHFSYRMLYDVHNTDVHCTLYIAYNLYTSSIMYGFIVCSIQYSTVQFRTMYGIPFGPYIVRWHSIRGVVYREYRVYIVYCTLYRVYTVHTDVHR